MGDPAIPTAVDRAETQALAERIVQSVIEDEPMPLDLAGQNSPGGRLVYLSDVEDLVAQLAKEISLLRRQLNGETVD